jgi:hypothetical protein
MTTNMTLIQGGGEENAKLFAKLIAHPASFTETEFQALTQQFADKIDLALMGQLFRARLKAVPFSDPLVNRIFISTLDGDDDVADELLAVHLRCEKIGLKRAK